MTLAKLSVDSPRKSYRNISSQTEDSSSTTFAKEPELASSKDITPNTSNKSNGSLDRSKVDSRPPNADLKSKDLSGDEFTVYIVVITALCFLLGYGFMILDEKEKQNPWFLNYWCSTKDISYMALNNALGCLLVIFITSIRLVTGDPHRRAAGKMGKHQGWSYFYDLMAALIVRIGWFWHWEYICSALPDRTTL